MTWVSVQRRVGLNITSRQTMGGTFRYKIPFGTIHFLLLLTMTELGYGLQIMFGVPFKFDYRENGLEVFSS